jgi:hypothetical protein
MDMADILMFKRTAAKTLLSLFEEQVAKWEKSEDFKPNKVHDADATYEGLNAGHALRTAGMQTLAFIKQFRDFGEDFVDLFEDVGENEANRLKRTTGFGRRYLFSRVSSEVVGGLSKLVALWSEMNL